MAAKNTVKKKRTEYSSRITFDENFQKIVQFYLFETPIEGASHRGKTFKDMGWTGSSRYQMLERLLKSASGMNDDHWNILESQSEVRKQSKDVAQDRQFIYSDQSKGRVPTFIYSIRNAFAHGSFDILEIKGERHYFFENEYRGNLRTRMLLSERTLLEWIKIIKTKPEYLTKKAQKKRKQ